MGAADPGADQPRIRTPYLWAIGLLFAASVVGLVACFGAQVLLALHGGAAHHTYAGRNAVLLKSRWAVGVFLASFGCLAATITLALMAPRGSAGGDRSG